MISYFQFLLLSADEQENCLLEKGVFLLSYRQQEAEILLYALNNFFVEMHVNQQGQVLEIIAFKSPHCLEKHVGHISLAQL